MHSQIASLLGVAVCAAALSTAPAPAERLAVPTVIDRTFHPDYSHALTPDQMTRAWNAEIDRVFQTPVSGGG